MSIPDRPPLGSISWFDLTVDNAEDVRDFYREVVGWRVETVPMGDYEDYSMCPPTGDAAVAGVCHARGGNADLPPQWLAYVTVADVEASAARCREMGGKVLLEPKIMGGYGRYCVIEDPAGAVVALFEPTR